MHDSLRKRYNLRRKQELAPRACEERDADLSSDLACLRGHHLMGVLRVDSRHTPNEAIALTMEEFSGDVRES